MSERRRLRCKSLDPQEAWVRPPALKIRRGRGGHIVDVPPPLIDDMDSEDVTIVKYVVVRRWSRAEQFGLDHCTYIKIQQMKLPAGLLDVCWWLRQARASCARDLDFIEWFAGVGHVFKAMIEAWFSAVKCDIKFDEVAHDVICKEGMLFAI